MSDDGWLAMPTRQRAFDGYSWWWFSGGDARFGPPHSMTTHDVRGDCHGDVTLRSDWLADRVERVTLSENLLESPCALVTSRWGLSANMERVMRAQAQSDPAQVCVYARARSFVREGFVFPPVSPFFPPPLPHHVERARALPARDSLVTCVVPVRKRCEEEVMGR
jgi:hypothetical protein